MATHQVNLDALIERQDFESGEAVDMSSNATTFSLTSLRDSEAVFKLLRKPEFQRTTDNWTPRKIVNFIKSFLDRNLVPASVLWQSKETSSIFVIDGAHRISALIAWVNNDYGAGELSKKFFNDDIPAAQKKWDKTTRELVEAEIGSYSEVVKAPFDSSSAQDDATKVRGAVASTRGIPTQWVEGDAKIAQKAFLDINKNPAIIDNTELDVIQARAKPNAIAVRAIINAGKGYKYWKQFGQKKEEIERLAKSIYQTLFGEIVELKLHSPDVPRAGEPYSAAAFKLILDLVNVFNEITPAMWQTSKTGTGVGANALPDDPDGKTTVKYLRRVKKLAELVSSPLKGSIGLDPTVYAYGATGKFHPAAFLAAMRFIEKLDRDNKLIQFTTVRECFEEFLVRNKNFINQLGHSKGGGLRSMGPLVTLHTLLLDQLLAAKKAGRTLTDADIIKELKKNDSLANLEPTKKPKKLTTQRARFPRAVEAAATVREVIERRPCCKICLARCPEYVRSKDHKLDVKKGGKGDLDNLEFTHPYCNHSKDGLRAVGFMK